MNLRNHEPTLPFVHRLPPHRPRTVRWVVMTVLLLFAAVAASHL